MHPQVFALGSTLSFHCAALEKTKTIVRRALFLLLLVFLLMELFGGIGFDVFDNDFTNSSEELESLSDDIMERINSTNEKKLQPKVAGTLRRCSMENAQEISRRDKETTNEMSNAQNEISTTQSGRELNASVFLTGEQTCSGEFTGIKKDLEASEGGIRAESSSCDGKVFDHVFRFVEPDGFQSVRNSEVPDEGIHLTQDVSVQSNAGTMKNSESSGSDKFERLGRRDVDANCVLVDSAKFVALLIENLLQFPKLLKEWASKTLAKTKAMRTLTEKGVEMNVTGEFVPECASIRDQQKGRENNYTEDLVGALGFPLGMSVATVLAEVMESNNCLKQSISADDMSELLGSAIRESLNKVLGSGCNRLVRDFEVAFSSTFKTINRVKQVHYQKKITSEPTEKKIQNSDGQLSGLETVGYLKEEYANFLPNLQGKIREKTDWSQAIEQTASTLMSRRGTEMKDKNQQSCKPSFLQSAVQVTTKSDDECSVDNCRGDCECKSSIKETVSVKDCNALTCQNSSLVDQHDGSVTPSVLATVGYDDLKEEYAKVLPNLQQKIREKTNCSQAIEQTPGTLTSRRSIEMKDNNQQSCIPSFLQFAVQVITKSEDECTAKNCREDCECRSCITETSSVKDCNALTCQNSSLVNKHNGIVTPSHREMGFANSEIEDISQKLKNVKLESAYSKNNSIGNAPSLSSDRLASTARSFEEYDSKLASGSFENGITSNVSAPHLHQQVVLHEDSQRQPATNTVSSIVPHTEWPQSISRVFERSLIEQKRCNNLRELEIGIKLKQLQLKEAKMTVAAESNALQRQSITINRSKVSFKESKFIDQKLNTAYVELNRTCADHLVAGLVLMFFALAYGSWKYSYSHFSDAFEMCRANTKEQQKSSWFYNPMNSLAGHFQTLLCEFIVIGKMLFGWAVIAFFATSLLRRSVASSSQAMPTTIIMIVLGLVCGYAGKLSVDSVGGNGFQWLLHWEALCLLHAVSACFPALLLRILNGPVSSYERVQEKAFLIPLGIRKFVFHMLLLVLPVMAGLAPFASAREWKKHFSLVISDNVVEPVRISVIDYFGQFMGV